MACALRAALGAHRRRRSFGAELFVDPGITAVGEAEKPERFQSHRRSQTIAVMAKAGMAGHPASEPS